MITTFLLGLAGSFGHCTGMCAGIQILLERSLGDRFTRSGRWLVHAGRLAGYSLLGLLAGLAGKTLGPLAEGLAIFQGALAFYAALAGLYFMLALVGIAPGPELLFPGLAARWRELFRAVSATERFRFPLIGIGMVWGLLPCGLVLAALFTAAVSAEPGTGALRMAAFGLGTLPALVSVGWLAGRLHLGAWPRYGAAAALGLFSVQLALRGMAAFGLVEHVMLGKVMLW